MIETVPYLMAISLLFAVIAACISILNWIRWNNIETDTMKARVFLDKSFLKSNFRMTIATVVIVGGMVGLHSLMEYFEIVGIDFTGFYLFYYGLLPVATGCLMLMAYLWYKLLHIKFKDII